SSELDADRAERHRVAGLLGVVGVRADDHAGRLRAPLHQLLEVGEGAALARRGVAADETLHHFGRGGLDFTRVHRTGRAVDGQVVALVEHAAVDGQRALLVIDVQRRGAAHADLAHLTGHEGRMRGYATARGQDAFRRDHAAKVFRGRLDADEQNLLTLFGGFN